MVDKNIEVEIRSFISEDQYKKLLEFFKQNSKLIEEDSQETHYLNSDIDLRIQKNNFGTRMWMKKGKIHDETRKETEIITKNSEDFEKLKNIFNSLGIDTKIIWIRDRKEFEWENISVCLDYTKGYGYIIEFEKMSSEEEKVTTLIGLKQKFKELGIEITPKEEFEKKFKDYEENWKDLTKMKIFLASSKNNYNRIPEIKKSLEEKGYKIYLPNSFDNPFKEDQLKIINKEEHIKWKSEMMRREKINIEPVDAILVLNFEKEGQANYIGGATFLEIYKAWELGKKIFLINPIPESNFKDELIGINPIILNGDLTRIK